MRQPEPRFALERLATLEDLSPAALRLEGSDERLGTLERGARDVKPVRHLHVLAIRERIREPLAEPHVAGGNGLGARAALGPAGRGAFEDVSHGWLSETQDSALQPA